MSRKFLLNNKKLQIIKNIINKSLKNLIFGFLVYSKCYSVVLNVINMVSESLKHVNIDIEKLSERLNVTINNILVKI